MSLRIHAFLIQQFIRNMFLCNNLWFLHECPVYRTYVLGHTHLPVHGRWHFRKHHRAASPQSSRQFCIAIYLRIIYSEINLGRTQRKSMDNSVHVVHCEQCDCRHCIPLLWVRLAVKAWLKIDLKFMGFQPIFSLGPSQSRLKKASNLFR